MKPVHATGILALGVCAALFSSCPSTQPVGPHSYTPAADGKARLERVFATLKKGGTVNVAALGGSITTGYLANPPDANGWAGLVRAWFESTAAATGGRVNYFNLGVSGTDSAAASVRIKDQIQARHIDLVIVEFAINDQWLDPNVRRESYEGVLRQILVLPQKPAVLCLFLCQKGAQAKGQQFEQQPLAEHYLLPWVSFGDRFQADVDKGRARWDDVFPPNEQIHPNDAGHGYIAKIIIEYLASVWKNLPAGAGERIPDGIAAPLISDAYQFTAHYGNADLKPVLNRGWTEGSDTHGEWVARGGAKAGWTAKTDKAEISFKVRGEIIGVFFAESDQYRNAEAWIDDKIDDRVNLSGYVSYRTGYLGWKYVEVARGLSTGEHVLHVRVADDDWATSGRSVNIVTIITAGNRE